jgi:mannose-6-phosphate isomerase-like protein (cupin superfamily)
LNKGANGRLVVTGETAEGQAVIVSDNHVPEMHLMGGVVRARMLWGRDDVATLPDAGTQPSWQGGVPPPGGCRFSTLTIAAGATGDYHAFIVSAMEDMAEPQYPGFHKTPTIDFIVVVDGEITLEVDLGDERVLRKGDSAVLNGVRHRWHNRGTSDTTIVAVMLGAALCPRP